MEKSLWNGGKLLVYPNPFFLSWKTRLSMRRFMGKRSIPAMSGKRKPLAIWLSLGNHQSSRSGWRRRCQGRCRGVCILERNGVTPRQNPRPQAPQKKKCTSPPSMPSWLADQVGWLSSGCLPEPLGAVTYHSPVRIVLHSFSRYLCSSFYPYNSPCFSLFFSLFILLLFALSSPPPVSLSLSLSPSDNIHVFRCFSPDLPMDGKKQKNECHFQNRNEPSGWSPQIPRSGWVANPGKAPHPRGPTEVSPRTIQKRVVRGNKVYIIFKSMGISQENHGFQLWLWTILMCWICRSSICDLKTNGQSLCLFSYRQMNMHPLHLEWWSVGGNCPKTAKLDKGSWNAGKPRMHQIYEPQQIVAIVHKTMTVTSSLIPPVFNTLQKRYPNRWIQCLKPGFLRSGHGPHGTPTDPNLWSAPGLGHGLLGNDEFAIFGVPRSERFWHVQIPEFRPLVCTNQEQPSFPGQNWRWKPL